METRLWYLSYKGERLTKSPLSYSQAEKQQNACIMNFGYRPDIFLEKDKNDLSKTQQRSNVVSAKQDN